MNANVGLAMLRKVFPETTGLAIEQLREETASAADVILAAGGRQFAVEFKAAATSDAVDRAIHQAGNSAPDGMVPLVVVPYMGDAGRQLCRAAAISWLDLSGNADIDAPPIRIRILSEPNRYRRPGRPEALFAPRSARLARLLLSHPNRIWPQAGLTRATGLSSGFLSRLLPRYVESAYLELGKTGRTKRYKLLEPVRLLDAWRAEYEFGRHTIVQGHIASRNGPELLRDLGYKLRMQGAEYAATGLSSAWLFEPHAAFRTVTLFMETLPDKVLLAKLGFIEGARGSNTWLVVPNDDGVFIDATERDGVRCVSAIQTYLDLKAQPERAEEAAAELRRTQLSWLGQWPEQIA